jgi:hypothetical protein
LNFLYSYSLIELVLDSFWFFSWELGAFAIRVETFFGFLINAFFKWEFLNFGAFFTFEINSSDIEFESWLFNNNSFNGNMLINYITFDFNKRCKFLKIINSRVNNFPAFFQFFYSYMTQSQTKTTNYFFWITTKLFYYLIKLNHLFFNFFRNKFLLNQFSQFLKIYKNLHLNCFLIRPPLNYPCKLSTIFII